VSRLLPAAVILLALAFAAPAIVMLWLAVFGATLTDGQVVAASVLAVISIPIGCAGLFLVSEQWAAEVER